MKLFGIKPYYIFNICASLCVQIIALILVYILTPEDYGYYSLITSVAQIMFILCSGWTNATVVNIGTREYKDTGTYKDLIIYRLIIVSSCFVLISIIFYLCRSHITEFVGNGEKYNLTYLFFLGLIFNDFVYQIFYPGEKNTFQTITMLFFNSSILLCVFLFVKSLSEYIYINTIIQTLLFIFLLSAFFIYYRKSEFSFSPSKFKTILTYSGWQLFGVLGLYLINLGSNYILRGNNIEVGEIGLYNFAYKLFCCFVPVFSLLGVVLPKWIHDKNINNKWLFIKRRMCIVIIILIVCYILVWCLLPVFLRIINKVEYSHSTDYFILLLPAFVFYSINQILNIVILNTPYYKYSQIISIAQGLVLILVSSCMVRLWDVYGAVLGNIMSFLVGTILYTYVFKIKINNSIQ